MPTFTSPVRSAGLAAVALSLTTLFVAACGGSEDSAPTTASAEPPVITPVDTMSTTEPPSTVTAEPATTRTVTHELGVSEIPVDPQRIVVVDRRGTLAFLLELGFEPVGSLEATWLFGQPFHPLIADRAAAAGVEPIDDTDGPNLEQIATLRPDLIIGNVRDMGETADTLAEIAPTVGLVWDFTDPWANVLTIGETLDRADEAQALVDDFDVSLADAIAEVEDPGTVSIIGLFAIDDIRIYREHHLFGRFTEQLGGVIVPAEADLPYDPEDNEVNYVSMEEIGLASGDRLISFVNIGGEANASYEELRSGPLVQTLPAFQTGQVLETDHQLAIGVAGSAGIHAMLDQLVEFYTS